MCSVLSRYLILTFFLLEAMAQENEASLEKLRDFNKYLKKCEVTGLFNCAAKRLLTSLENAAVEQNFQILPGIDLVRDTITSPRMARTLTQMNFSQNYFERDGDLLHLMVNGTSRFLSGRTLKIKIPNINSEKIERAIEEGRGKIKKMMGPLILGIGLKLVTVISIVLIGLTLFTTKAMIFGKVALVISLILFAQQFFIRRNISPDPFGFSYVSSTDLGGKYPFGYGTNSLGGWGPIDKYPY